MNIYTTFVSSVKNQFVKRAFVKAIIKNSLWLLGDRVLRIAIGMFINIWITRYLGPEQFGIWSYCISFAGLFVVFSNLGLDTIIVRELIKTPERETEILGTAFWLKLLAGILTFLGTLIAIFQVRNGDILTLWLVGLYSGGYIFQSLNVISYYFQSKVQSKFTVLSSGFSFILVTIAKVILLFIKAPLLAFAVIGLGEIILTALFLVISYRANHRYISQWKYQYNLAKNLLKYSWPMILAGASTMIMLRIDQIMIGNILGDREVGIFAAASRISEISFFIPMAIISSSTYSIHEAKKQGNTDIYISRLNNLLNITILLSLGVTIPFSLLSDVIISSLLGDNYTESANLLSIYIWSGIFSCIGAASGIWMTAEGLQRNMFYRNFYGMLVNVILNYWWINKYGVIGAAMATIISQIMMGYISDYFFLSTRQLFHMKTRSLFLINILNKSI